MWKSKKSATDRLSEISSRATHVLFEGGLPISGTEFGPLFVKDANFLEKKKIQVGIILHGSDIRIPSKHVELNGLLSPFAEQDEWTTSLEIKSSRLHQVLNGLPKIKKFITTTDLLDYVSDGIWLPVSVDTEALNSSREAFSDDIVRILHLPSNRRIKGSEQVDIEMALLTSDARFEYRSLTGLSRKEVIEQIDWADIVLDQFGVGGYGVLACEAMAMCRVVICRLNPIVEIHQPGLPIINLEVKNLAEGIRGLVSDLEQAKNLATLGRDYAFNFHNGRMSSEVLANFIGIPLKLQSQISAATKL